MLWQGCALVPAAGGAAQWGLGSLGCLPHCPHAAACSQPACLFWIASPSCGSTLGWRLPPSMALRARGQPPVWRVGLAAASTPPKAPRHWGAVATKQPRITARSEASRSKIAHSGLQHSKSMASLLPEVWLCRPSLQNPFLLGLILTSAPGTIAMIVLHTTFRCDTTTNTPTQCINTLDNNHMQSTIG